MSSGMADHFFPPGQDELPAPERPSATESETLQDFIEGTPRKKQVRSQDLGEGLDSATSPVIDQ